MRIVRRKLTIKEQATLWDIWVNMSARSRSASRERITVRSDAFTTGEALDPLALLGPLKESLTSFDVPLAVVLTDGKETVTYGLSAFVSKQYMIKQDIVHFGFKRLDLRSLRVKIEYDIHIDG